MSFNMSLIIAVCFLITIVIILQKILSSTRDVMSIFNIWMQGGGIQLISVKDETYHITGLDNLMKELSDLVVTKTQCWPMFWSFCHLFVYKQWTPVKVWKKTSLKVGFHFYTYNRLHGWCTDILYCLSIIDSFRCNIFSIYKS